MTVITYTFAPVTRTFRADAILAGDQTDSDVAAIQGGKGGFYIAFDTARDRQVDGRIFNEDASPRTGEFKVNTTDLGNQLHPSVASLSNGTIITLFEDHPRESQPEGWAVRGRLLDGTGEGGSDFLVPRVENLRTVFGPHAAALTNGGFTAMWSQVVSEDSALFVQRYGRSGAKAGGIINVDIQTPDIDLITSESIAGLANGGFVTLIGKSGLGQDTVMFQRFAANGAALDASGRRVEVFNHDSLPNDQRLSASVNVAGLPDGGFVVAYGAGTRQDGDIDGDIIVSIYNANGTARTERLRVGSDNLRDSDAGTAGDQDEPELTVLSNGAIVVSWTDHEGTNTNIEARVLDRHGRALTDVVALAASARGESDAALAGLLNGKLVATWTVSDEGGGNGKGIQGREFELSRTVTGDGTGETLSGDSLRDTILGLGGNDVLNGRDGNDRLDGGTGADRMVGGRDNDLYLVDRSIDLVVETFGQGKDAVLSSSSFSLASRGAHVEIFKLTGTGNASGTGNALDNRIIGNVGDNLLNGATGSDVITGGAGEDIFRFTNSLIPANVDRITDFTIADDSFSLENAVFLDLPAGPLAASAFHTGSAAGDAGDRIIYNSATGALLFDPDGTGPAAAEPFAVVSRGLAMTHEDFFIT